MRGVYTRVAVGRAGVVREVRSAGPLMAALATPIPFRGPWLTAVLNEQSAHRSFATRPVAVVVEPHRPGPPEAAAFLSLRRRGPVTAVTMLGSGVEPRPGGLPTARLLARDEAAAPLLAAGIADLLDSLRGPWRLRLTGLPLGDPTARRLAARYPDALIGTVRSSRTVDALDTVGTVLRSRDPQVLERWLPGLLAREPDPRARRFLRAGARLHAAIGQVEIAVVAEAGAVRAGLLTMVDGTGRWPWWGSSDIGGLGTEMGAPLAGLTVPARRWP
jgi:hypothetical protein